MEKLALFTVDAQVIFRSERQRQRDGEGAEGVPAARVKRVK